MNTNLQGKVAIITGGSKGIGKATAIALATEGARIAICAREELALTQTRHELEDKLHTDVVAVKANVTKSNDIRRFVETVVKKFDRIDILVNNAGGAGIGGLFRTSDEDWEYHLQLKVLGYIRMAREVIPIMKKNGGGKIINIVGTRGKEPNPLFMVPGATNAALLNFTKSLSREVENDNIQVNAVNPGSTETTLSSEIATSLAEISGKSPEEIRISMAAGYPTGRIARPEEIAQVVLFLASESANYINGTSIDVDAGRLSGLW